MLQGQLFNTAGDFISDVYKNTASPRVYIARNAFQPESGQREWFQQGLSLRDAVATANAYQQASSDDCYTTVNGFGWVKGTGRTVSDVTQLTCLFADFDYYKTEYGHLNFSDFADQVIKANPWMPAPTMVMDSGNGCWMFWQFKRPMKMPSPYNWLAQWQLCQDFLVSQLKPYGADKACTDAARVVRLTGTVNSKTGRTAKVWKTKGKYEFKDLKQAINDEWRKQGSEKRKAFDLVPLDVKQTKSKPKSGRKISSLFNWYSLAYKRLQDLRELARLRGGKYTEHRRMVIWFYAVEAANYCRDEKTLRAEVESFIRDYIDDSEHYQKTVNYESTVRRFNAFNDMRMSGVFDHRKIDEVLGFHGTKYKLSRDYMVEVLQVTEAEGRKLKAILPRTVKRERNTVAKRLKRRQEGVQARDDYNNQRQVQVAENVSEALRLRLDGLSVRAIARQMNVSVGSVHNWLKKATKEA